MIKKFISKIKKKENTFYALCYKCIFFILNFHLPVNKLTKPFFKLLYTTHIFLREFFRSALKVFYYEPLFRARCVKVGKNLIMEKLPYISGNGKIFIGDNVRLSFKPNFLVGTCTFDNALLKIGNHTFLGNGVTVIVAKYVEIGNNCLIAGGVRIADNDGHPVDFKKRRDGLPVEEKGIKPVIINDDVWIGAQATILKGVTIGERSIIGASSVVTKDVPPDCIVAGNPAKVVKILGKEFQD